MFKINPAVQQSSRNRFKAAAGHFYPMLFSANVLSTMSV